MKPRNKMRFGTKIFATWLIAVIVFVGIGSNLLIFTKASSFFVPGVPEIVIPILEPPSQTTRETTKTIWEKINKVYQDLGALGFKNALKKMVSNIAVDTATFLATGDKGQAPMFQTSFADYIRDEGDAFLGDALNNQVKEMWGVDLCEPLNPLAKVNIEIMAREYFREQRPQCTFTKMRKNIVSLGDVKLIDLPAVAEMFNPASNELGALLQITTVVDQGRKKAMDDAKLVAQIEQGFKSVRSKITEKILTPAGITKFMAELPLQGAFDIEGKYTGSLAADFLGPFINTFVSKLMKQYKEGLVGDSGSGRGGTGGTYGPNFGTRTPVQAAAERFAALGQPNYNYGGNIDVLNSLSCNTEQQFSCTIDTAFKTAIEQGLTVKAALEQGLLHSDWPFGYRANKTGGTDDINKQIYSYRSLVILRKYRIIPVGWELAAAYYKDFDRSGEPLTLDRLASLDFGNVDSPYYRLIDPGWVLKAPNSICTKQGPGELAEGETYSVAFDRNQNNVIDEDERQEFVVRKNYCADERSCISEDAKGNCLYYGYCTKEKPIWRIQGDACEAVFNTCQTYTDAQGLQVSYLANTLAHRGDGVCGPDNTGCREYCYQRDPASTFWACGAGSGDNKVYLDRGASGNECPTDEAGCSRLIRMSGGLTNPSNWIPNSSFEIFPADVDPTEFQAAYHQTTNFASLSGSGSYTTDAYEGSYALANSLSGSTSLSGSINTGEARGGKTFILSAWYKGGEVTLQISESGGPGLKFNTTSNWQQAYVEYTFPPTDTSVEVGFSINGGSGTIIDALALVQSTGSSRTFVPAYGQANAVNLKKAPDYMECDKYNNIVDYVDNCSYIWRDDIEKCVAGGSYLCLDYAAECEPADASCRAYRPVSYDGPIVPGVVSGNDYCPAECVGYKSYLEQPSFFEPVVPAGRNPVNLIPATAKSCGAASNGCEEFTNLSEGQSGENKEYYSSLRYCVLPDNAGVETYYSWASGDETGNQLRSWSLLQSNLGGGAYPCTNPAADGSGNTSCRDSANRDDQYGAQLCTLGNTDPDYNPAFNKDCVEFINSTTGQAVWIRYSRIVFAAEDCMPLRMSNGGGVYSAITALSQSCPAEHNGCREYKGSTSNNLNMILNDDFEDGGRQGWRNGSPSNEALLPNGHSLVSGANEIIAKAVGGKLRKGKAYSLSFWAKAGNFASNSIKSISFSGDAVFNNSAVPLSSNWTAYQFNLDNFGRDSVSSEELRLDVGGVMYIDDIQLTETRDNVYLIKDSWVTPLSCDNPINNPNGVGQTNPIVGTKPGEMLGCEQYKDESGRDWYLKSFGRLCSDEAVGCEPMIMTYDSSAPYEESFDRLVQNDKGYSVPADKLVYLVYDRDKTCGQPGCTNLGLVEPTRQADSSQLEISEKNLILNPDSFSGLASPFCLAEAEWCDGFETVGGSSAGKEYFKNPSIYTCEYKQVAGRYAWYMSGSEEACPSIVTGTNGRCLGGRSSVDANQVSNVCSSSNECKNYANLKQSGLCSSWTALCPEAANQCSEYQDPSSPAGCDKGAVNGEFAVKSNGEVVPPCDYYYYKSNTVEECDRLDPVAGCIGFHDTYGGSDNYYSTLRCSNNPALPCETNQDCIIAGQGGQCTYLPQKKQVIDYNIKQSVPAVNPPANR